MTWRDSCEESCHHSGLIGHLSDDHAIILAKGIVESQTSPSELLNERAVNFFTVLWILGERRPGVGRVSKLRHVMRHCIPFGGEKFVPCTNPWFESLKRGESIRILDFDQQPM